MVGENKNFYLVDFENIQSPIKQMASDKLAYFVVFVGAKQTKISFDIADTMQRMGNKARYIRVDTCAKNALDFYIAYYIGKLASENPDAEFRVVSKDTGYDPLIRHLREQGIKCRRVAGPLPQAERMIVPDSAKDQVDLVCEKLKKSRGNNTLPSKHSSLRSYIKSVFSNKISDKDSDEIISSLIKMGYLSIENGKALYLSL